MAGKVLLLLLALVALTAAPAFAKHVHNHADGREKTHGPHQYFSVVRDPEWRVTQGLLGESYASGYFDDNMLTTGWGELFVSTNPSYPDAETMYAAGLLEGTLTAVGIADNYANLYGGFNPLPPAQEAFLAENLAYTQMAINDSAYPAAYWAQVSLVLTQLQGVYDGYTKNAQSGQELSLIQVLALSAQGDLEDISIAVGDTKPVASPAHCSGLVKLTANLSELYVGQTTWNVYISMLRVFKTYSFALQAAETAAETIAFSSYPGALLSIDDFYSTSARLAVFETTNGCLNLTMYATITPTTGVLSWIRTMIANRMAGSASAWQAVFGLYNSYTYNNQFVAVDYNLFTPGQPLVPNTVVISEQYPGGYVVTDVTDIVSYGYFPSYNVPFTPSIYEMCMFPQSVAQYGPSLLAYQNAARAEIFRRDQGAIDSLVDFQAMMRYNDWQNDPLALGNAGLQISSRFDLVNITYENNPLLSKACFGGIDSKVTSFGLSQSGVPVVLAQSGPSHDDQAPFAWANGWSNVQGLGQPDVYDFDWMTFDSTAALEAVAEARSSAL